MRGLRITVECTMVQRYLTYQVLRRDASRDDIGQTATARASSISVIEPRSWPMTSKKLSRCSWVRARADFRFPAGNLVEEEHGGRRSGLAAQARVDDLLTQDDLDFMHLPIGNCRSLHPWEHTHTLPRAAIVTRPEDRCRSSGHPMAMPLISTANTSSASSTTATTVWNLAGEVLRRLDVGGGHDFPHAQPTDS